MASGASCLHFWLSAPPPLSFCVRLHEFEIWRLIHPANGGKDRMLMTWLSTFGYLLNKVIPLPSLQFRSVRAARTTFDSTRIGMKAVLNANAHHAVKMRSSVTVRRFLRKRASRRPGASVRKMYLMSQSALPCETQVK